MKEYLLDEQLIFALPVLYRFAQLRDREWLPGALGGQCVHDVARAVRFTPRSSRYAAHEYGGCPRRSTVMTRRRQRRPGLPTGIGSRCSLAGP